ncbi:hypothetical protein HPB52_017300 [Rhipicephalus sanguineus]|uniref:Tetraspanin n=1 Tax=Rhipicephalus sanguineus TaxID=34632 RepID=A0A9D4QAI9_RHISA|nr:hypothetical protein HPB52_017300 [Rhipicephalus sanguineus]
MDTDNTRLFSKMTTRSGISPPGTGARAPTAGRKSTDIAGAKAGAAGGTFRVVMSPRGPDVAAGPTATGKRPSQPLPPPAAFPQSSAARPSQSHGPGAAGAAIPGSSPTVATNPGVAPAAAATDVCTLPTSTGPALGVANTAPPARADFFAIGPGPGFGPAGIGANYGVPTTGTSVSTPFSPVLDSELFADSESREEPEYELSDTTILDVNPCLLLPLSGCNFFFIVASVVVFLGALYAYFDQESTPAATSANTWLVYLFLHLEIVLMVLSLGVFIVASIGFIGALRENIDLLDLYTTLQGAFVSAEVVFIVTLFFLPLIGREFVISHITTELIVHYRDKLDYQREIDYVQSSLHCCGMTDNTYRDWNANPYFNCSPTNPSAERCSVPPSCCRQIKVPDIADYDSGTDAPKAEAVMASKSGAYESGGASADGDGYVTTLCGRGVMNLKEQEAWKVAEHYAATRPPLVKLWNNTLPHLKACTIVRSTKNMPLLGRS